MQTITCNVYKVTEKEIKDNLALYNNDMIGECLSQLLNNLRDVITGADPNVITIQELIDTTECCIVLERDPEVLIKEFAFLCMDAEVRDALERDDNFYVLLEKNNGTKIAISRDEIIY